MNIEQVNKALKISGKRVKAVKDRGTAEHTDNIRFFFFFNGKMWIVFLDSGIIKSILQQQVINRKYTVQINGQEGTNTKCLYFANYDYESHKYNDILTA